MEAERDNIRARLDRAIRAGEEHFGEDAIRYKLSLFANGRARNVFPRSVDGHWVALQRADNDAHIGLSLRCLEAEAERDQLRDENENLRTVMIAAAEEIHEHWAAHCDAEGYGPANLMHRLEKGIPAQYGYKAGDFERLRAEVEALRADAERYRWLRTQAVWANPATPGADMVWCVIGVGASECRPCELAELDVAIDAARKG